MSRRYSFKKVTTGEPGRCYYCQKQNTYFALYDERDRSEVFACPVCALRVGKIKRLQKMLRKYPLRVKSFKIETNSLIKKEEVGALVGGLYG